jgi:hypothetical protein
MSFFEGLEKHIAASKECTGPDSFRGVETRLRATIMVLQQRLKDASHIVEEMQCECSYPDECSRCHLLNDFLRKEPTDPELYEKDAQCPT